MQSIEEIDITGVLIQIEKKNIQIWQMLPQSFFNSLGNDLVCNTTEGLQTNDIVDSLGAEFDNLSRQKPPFAWHQSIIEIEKSDTPNNKRGQRPPFVMSAVGQWP